MIETLSPIDSLPRPASNGNLTGEGYTLQRLLVEAGQFSTFVPVKNTVILANTEIQAPFSIILGEATPVVLFHQGFAYGEKDALFNQYVLETHQKHHRSALLARVIFVDNQGQVYRDVDIKGIGFLYPTYGMTALPYNGLGYRNRTGERFGFLSQTEAGLDFENSKRLLELGVRTNGVLGVARLDEIVLGGKVISVAKAQELGVLPPGFIPVVEIRAFGTKVRVQDVLDKSSYSYAMMTDAKRLVEQELHQGLSWKDYFIWFTTTLGENMGKMHQAGLSHGHINTHNVTLDCRLVDLNNTKALSMKRFAHDFYHAWNTLIEYQKYFKSTLECSVSSPDLLSSLMAGYHLGVKSIRMVT